VVMGVYSGWDCLLLKYGGEVFLERQKVSCVWSILACCRSGGIQPVVVCRYMCLCIIIIIIIIIF
jgi:hypothetical protein